MGLQLLGLALVAFSTTLPEASGVACLALVAWQVLPTRRRAHAMLCPTKSVEACSLRVLVTSTKLHAVSGLACRQLAFSHQ